MNKKTELVTAFKSANDVCRTMWHIVDREGKDTNWEGFKKILDKELKLQHKLMYKDGVALL